MNALPVSCRHNDFAIHYASGENLATSISYC